MSFYFRCFLLRLLWEGGFGCETKDGFRAERRRYPRLRKQSRLFDRGALVALSLAAKQIRLILGLGQTTAAFVASLIHLETSAKSDGSGVNCPSNRGEKRSLLFLKLGNRLTESPILKSSQPDQEGETDNIKNAGASLRAGTRYGQAPSPN